METQVFRMPDRDATGFEGREDASTPETCPHGHGALRLWSGKLRCWDCGWPWGAGWGPPEKHGIYDIFISYAGADFTEYINPLVTRFRASRLSVWMDRTEITWGDTIVGRVNDGLRSSRFVLVCLSRNFLARSWPETELNAVLNIQSSDGRERTLPLILNSRSEVFRRYPLLAGLVTRDYDAGVDALTTELLALVGVDVERDTIDVTVESAYTSTSVVLRPNLRDTLERLIDMATAALGLQREADVGAYKPFKFHWVLVDVKVERDWKTLERTKQQRTLAFLEGSSGEPLRLGDEGLRIFQVGLKPGTIFHIYAIEDPDEPVPPAALSI